MSVSLRENITAVIETCFSETKDEIQEVAINRILELIRNDKADRKTECHEEAKWCKDEPQSKVIRIEDAVQAIKEYLDLCCLTEAKFHKGFEDYNDEIAREIISVIVEPNSSEKPNNTAKIVKVARTSHRRIVRGGEWMEAEQSKKALMILQAYDAKAQKLKCCEELSELETALLKHINKGEHVDEILEEMADALIMIEQVKWLMPFGENRLDEMINFKLDRQLKRIRSEE